MACWRPSAGGRLNAYFDRSKPSTIQPSIHPSNPPQADQTPTRTHSPALMHSLMDPPTTVQCKQAVQSEAPPPSPLSSSLSVLRAHGRTGQPPSSPSDELLSSLSSPTVVLPGHMEPVL
mmetsp:Transcript_11345/g.27446  ORF Transcript_11345/g.27446 Transcript_11345/m.27446 type:complete len:119 (+) Transcript_11345:70-426(+)